MSIQPVLTLGGLLAGLIVGLTGMGGAAIVTPMLIFVFGIPAPIAVSTDVVSAAAMKPVGAAVHVMRRTPHLRIVFWMCVGSIPGVILGTVAFRAIVNGSAGSEMMRTFIGCALLFSVAMSLGRLRLTRYFSANANRPIFLSAKRRVTIVIIGLVVGTLVGLTSVGSGSLVAAAILMMFPAMLPSRLVGTDLAQAVPMLIVGAVAHWGLGEIDWSVAISLLIGQVPGVWLGARVSSRYDGQALRLLVLIMVGASGLALVGVPPVPVGLITLVCTVAIGFPIVFDAIRDRNVDDTEPESELVDRSTGGSGPD